MAKRNSGLRFQPSGGARATQLPVGKKQRLSIERLSHDGRGIAHEGGRTWFVAGALAGEEVEARVLAARCAASNPARWPVAAAAAPCSTCRTASRSP